MMGLFTKKTDEVTESDKDEKPIESYKVTYRGGHPDYPRAKVGAIEFQVFLDRFELKPKMATKWFSPLVIPFKDVGDLKIVERQVGTAEGILGGLNSRQLNQANNIHISFSHKGQEILLRLEMLTGVTVMGQAKKCKELEDRLNTNGIRQKFSASQPIQSYDVVEQLNKLSELHAKGSLTDEEFKDAKERILA